MTITTGSPVLNEDVTPPSATSRCDSVAELVGITLARLGIGHVFGVVGSGNFVVTNALRREGVPYTAARHEGGAATMADAYGRMSGKVGVVTTHQGCGLTNAVTGIGEAAKSRTPMIVVTADTAASAVRSNFTIDQDALARSVGAVAERIHSPQSAVADTVRAYRTAVNERRTVVLSLPTDIQTMEAPIGNGLTEPLEPRQRVRPSEAAVTKLAALIQGAKKPVFVAGRGGREAGPEIAALAETAGALVATSAVAHGLFNGDPYSLGISGGFSSPFTADAVREADLIVGWGCALNMWTMRHGSLIGPGTKVVQVDLDDSALGANRPIDLGVLGDCRETALAVLNELRSAGHQAVGLRTPEMADRIARHARWNSVETADLSTAEAIDPRVLSRELDLILPANRIVSVDSGNFMGYPSTYLSVPDEFGFCFTQAFQSIGLGLSSAIGAAIAHPERLPVLGTGDGGFLMAISELETLVRERIPMVVIVYNDSAYGAEVHHFDADDEDLEVVRFPTTDIASIAAGYGATAVTVRCLADLAPVEEWVAGPQNAPLVIDARIASDGGAWWLAEAFKGH
ncbi:thiamine pyrophosphate-binding protein [Arthrobacter sp. StoSoilB5]|uniref:thiamine pyrophosphate-binding protein n=1 Tax=Arthrobacter sp. StoSoilB5 TaxID=2830992 RepID=UPI001CC50E74|nr:thiamine pyrophosphate-binding protein [Arthrobacter sp. StoSoilB5]BCW45470.1 acetolactate synthase I/II/III large subunit [Arthrobacter sp. StoSoilB5]